MILPQIYDVYDCKYNRAGRFAVLIDKMNRATVIKAQFPRVICAGWLRMSTSIPDGSTVLHHAAASVSCTAAQAIKVRHGGPLIVIPAALAGVIPPNPRCGLIKLWCTVSSLKRGDSYFLMPRTPLRTSPSSPLNLSWPLLLQYFFIQ